jgi:hypothetical protein
MWLAGTRKPGGTYGNTGKLFRIRPEQDARGTDQKVEITLPAGVNAIDARISEADYRSRKYLVGGHTSNQVVDEHFRAHIQGIRAPNTVPTLAAAAGPGVTGSAVVAVAFWDQKTDEWSPLSGSSAAVSLTNQKRTTANIPTTSMDARVTHVGVWVSMDGGLFRLSTIRQLGVSTITEGVATLNLGEAFPTTFTAMPRGTVNAIYHERQAVAGNALNPDIVYVSSILYPERYEGLSFRTRHGEPIVGMIPTRGILLVMTPTSAYSLRGYTDSDMRMELIDAEVGCLSHWGLKVIRGNAWVPNDQGVWLFNGAFHQVLRDRQQEWADAYAANKLLFENGFALHDKNTFTYRFYLGGMNGAGDVPSELPAAPGGAVTKTLAWVADYRPTVPEISGTFIQPNWSYDRMARRTDSAAMLATPGTKRADAYFGYCDGFVRYEDATDDDDDSDTYVKRLWIRTKAYDMGDPGNSKVRGKRFPDLWSYFESETCVSIAYFRGGDEEAWQGLTPNNSSFWFKDTMAAGYETFYADDENCAAVPRTVVVHRPVKVSGRCLTVEFTVSDPLNVKWRGFGGFWLPGPATRGAVSKWLS